MGLMITRSVDKMIEDIISSTEDDPDKWTEISGAGHLLISQEAFDKKLQTAVRSRSWKVSRVQRDSESVLRIDKE